MMITGKEAEYNLFFIGLEKGLGRVGIFLSKKWEDKVININRESNF